MLVMPYIPGHAIETKSDQIESNQIKSNLSSGVIFALDFAHLALLSKCPLLISRDMETGLFPLLLLARGIPSHHLFAKLTTWITSKLHSNLTSSFKHLNANSIGGARAFDFFFNRYMAPYKCCSSSSSSIQIKAKQNLIKLNKFIKNKIK